MTKKRISLCALALCVFAHIAYADETITDFAQLETGYVHAIHKPSTIAALHTVVMESTTPIAIAGGRYSHGGHIWYPQGTVIDMKGLSAILNLDTVHKTITVQAGATWQSIQAYIKPYGLAVAVMQSYHDFTVGGSLSVNVHGRDIAYGPIVDTVLSIVALCADGQLVTASRTENCDLFRAAIGGYGACGIIVQATLQLTDDYPIERIVKHMPLAEYKSFFMTKIHNNDQVVFHNAQLYESKAGEILSITWYKTDKPLTNSNITRPVKRSYMKEQIGHALFAFVPLAKKLRLPLEMFLYKGTCVTMRNQEMSATVQMLEQLVKNNTTEILQEYFVPLHTLETFVALLRNTIRDYNINMLNISIRYVPQDATTLLSYASQDMFSLVLYINISTDTDSMVKAQEWTRMLIDGALNLGGSYYLPYVRFATQEQFEKGYPQHTALKEIKHQYDPDNKFLNCFTAQYLVA
jgi:FAD/FMN-containing dehydrogenase